ncbi:ORM1-like protein [Drosophila grimshawi]|uniref:GH16360 n=1 Tax=Drosophila grimshawi TaxID=7222 RepID=B4IYT7_DROGR|nr:ORM1-like protein [Drosophila grimshawi]XP_043071252.1 ORM1-like protein [Drosophila grimshawi]EDV96624.1 GH16360 [Drosophila grimshawi]
MTSIAGGHGETNPNSSWLSARGFWLAYFLGLLFVHLLLLSVPFVTIPVAWTVTNLLHNAVHLYFLHIIKGAPWLSIENDASRQWTHWEQIDDGVQMTPTRKFLTAVPIVLFLLTCLYTRNSTEHFIANFISLVVVTLPKLPQFHGVRLFNINKY